MDAKYPLLGMPPTNEASGHNCFQRIENNRSNMVSSL